VKVPRATELAGLFSYLLGLRAVFIRPRFFLGLVLTTCVAIACPAQEDAGAASGATPGATPGAPSKEKVVIKVGNLQLTQAEFESVVSTLEAQQGPSNLSRRAIAENYASLLMLAQQAVANHLDTSPEVSRQLAIDRNQILSNAQFASLKEQAKPTTEEISRYFSAHAEEYDVVDLRRLFVWQNSSGAKDSKGMSPQDAQALITAVRQAFVNGGDAAKLVQGKADVLLDAQPSPFQRGELPPKMNEMAFSLAQGQWGVVEQTPDALVLIYVVRRYRRDLKEVSPVIEKQVQNQKLRSALDDLKKSAGIWLDDQYFGAAMPASAASNELNPSAPTDSLRREDKDRDETQK